MNQPAVLFAIVFTTAAGFSQNSNLNNQNVNSSIDTVMPEKQVPNITLREALSLAEQYLHSSGIDTSRHHLSSINLIYLENTRVWRVIWDLNVPSDGGHLAVFVTMNKLVRLFGRDPLSREELAKLPSPSFTSGDKGLEGKDPIGALLNSLDPNGLWKNGLYPTLLLPESATATKIIEQLFKLSNFNEGRIHQYKVLEIRKVKIAPDTLDYSAVLINSNIGNKVILFQYQGAHAGWWTRVYDAK